LEFSFKIALAAKSAIEIISINQPQESVLTVIKAARKFCIEIVSDADLTIKNPWNFL
jgi:hypothetical protein